MTKAEKSARRGRGRPRTTNEENTGVVDPESVVELAYEMSRTEPLDSVTFVGLAKVLDVAPGSLHYHLGTKDDLTSAVLNLFYRNLLARLDELPPQADWRERIRSFAWTLMRCEREHRGAAEHIQTRARFRLFQKVREGETDYGAAYLDRAFAMFYEAGFDAACSALFYHVLAMHCLSAANAASAQLEPAAHERFLMDRAAAFPAGAMPGLDYALAEFARIREDDAFEFGLEALLDRFGAARREPETGQPPHTPR